MVAVHLRRLHGSSGKAEVPGEGDIMSCMSSFWSLLVTFVVFELPAAGATVEVETLMMAEDERR